MKKLLSIFANPLMPSIGDYYEPWTYDYENLITAPPQAAQPGGQAQVADQRPGHEGVLVGELGR